MEGLSDECIPSFARGLKILVVDHDTMSLMNMAWTLEQFSFKVTTTEMGSVALAMINEAEKDRSFDLVVVNVDMTDMSILEFIRILVKKNIHVILTTTSAHTEMAVKGLNEGASIFYEKPVCLDDLKHIWQHVCKRNRNSTEFGSNSGDEQEGKGKPAGRKPKNNLELEEPKNNLELEEPSGSVKVPKKRGRKSKNKEAEVEVEVEVEVVDCGAGHQEVADDPKGKRKVSEEEFQIISGNDYQSKKIRADTFNGSGDLLVFNDPKGKAKEVEEEARLIEVHDEPKETPNFGTGPMNINSENKDTEVGMEPEQIISISELEEENAEKNMRDKILIIAGEKKSHIVWTKELHYKFATAVSVLGDKAVPTAILETMNVPNVTLRQVASHLQKYKKQIKKIGNNTTPISTAGPESFRFNGRGFQQAPEMTGLHAHKQSQEGFNLGGDITQSLQKPVAKYNSTFQDAPFNFKERMKLATLYINAQNKNQPVLLPNVSSGNNLLMPVQGLDTLPNVSSGNQVLLPMQGLDAIPENVSSGNQLLMPVDTLSNVSSGNQVLLPMQGLDAIPRNISSGNQLLMPVQGLPNVSSGNQVLLSMQGLDAIPENVSSGNNLLMPVQELPNVSSGNQVLLPMQGLDAIPKNVSSGNNLLIPVQGQDTLPNVSLGNQVLLPMQGLDAIPRNVSSGNTLSNVSSGNQVLLPMQGLDAMPENIFSGNNLLMPIQGLDTLPNVSSGNQALLSMQGLNAITKNVSLGNNLLMPVQGLDTLPNVSSENQVLFSMQGLDAIPTNVSSGNQLLMPVQGLDLPNVSSENQMLLSMQGLDAVPENVYSENMMPIQGADAMPRQDSPKNPSIAENYLINFAEENKDLPATNVPAAPSTWPGNQHHQQKSIDCSEFLDFLVEDRDLDQYFDFPNSDWV